MKKVLVVILAYNASQHIAKLLARIPAGLFSPQAGFTCDILLLDDASPDDTLERAREYVTHHALPIRLLKNPVNQRYGGNQKIGYTYAIQNGYDIALMLHGDGQYPPEMIQDLITPLLNNEADAVLGSRMLTKSAALEGGMPKYKFVGNIVLTKIQNIMLGSNLSEFHTGFRAYSLAALKTLPYTHNSNDFDFDTDILIQFILSGKRIREIAIPTHYGDEVCHVNGIKYAYQVVRNSLLARCQPLGIFYHAKFDFESATDTTLRYQDKTAFKSSQSWAIDKIPANTTLLEIKHGTDLHVTRALSAKGCTTHVIAAGNLGDLPAKTQSRKADPAAGITLTPQESAVNAILMLDVIDHVANPEACMAQLHAQLQESIPQCYITTGNIGFFVVRLSLLFGQFNYGKHGILDRTHTRLFTFASLRRVLEMHGYQIETMEGIPAPFPLALKRQWLARCLLRLNSLLIRINKSWFSYQIAIIARPMPTLDQLITNATASEKP